MNRHIGKVLIAVGILVLLVTVGRGFFYAPNDAVEDTGIAVGQELTGAAVTSVKPAEQPARLVIPKLKIDTNVQALGITKKGNMAAPDNFTDVSWYKFGTLPGRIGSAVMSGHEDNAVSLDGVFKHLEDLEIGDDVYTVDKSGQTLRFKVTAKKVYPYNLSGPELEKIFTAKDKARLNLITCTGEWVQEIKTNDKRLVVFTELVGS